MTRGFSCAETSALLRSVDDGSVGNWFRSSSSGSPVLTSAGMGTKETSSTVPTVVRMPLTTRSVERNDTQAYFTRGGWLRNATRRITATTHSTGSTRTSGERLTRAHQGTGEGRRRNDDGGASGAGLICSISSELTTTLSKGISKPPAERSIKKRTVEVVIVHAKRSGNSGGRRSYPTKGVCVIGNATLWSQRLGERLPLNACK